MTQTLVTIFQLISTTLFLGYGLGCFVSSYLTSEFQRWGVSGLQRITGALQITGALGLLIGFRSPSVGFISATGLSFMMLCALIIRVRVKDPFRLFLPAIFLLLINCVIATDYIIRIYIDSSVS